LNQILALESQEIIEMETIQLEGLFESFRNNVNKMFDNLKDVFVKLGITFEESNKLSELERIMVSSLKKYLSDNYVPVVLEGKKQKKAQIAILFKDLMIL